MAGRWKDTNIEAGQGIADGCATVGEETRMYWKIVATASLLALPLSAMLWHASHANPQFRRYDVTLYKSLRVILRDGVCGLDLLSMPTKTASRTQFQSPLHVASTPGDHLLFFSTRKNGLYRQTWLVFPLWAPTIALSLLGLVPLCSGPLRTWRRKLKGWCLECGYDLRGNRSGRCPECGTRVHRSASWSRVPSRF